MPASEIGIDLGACMVCVYVKGREVVLIESSLVAVNRGGTPTLAVGIGTPDMAGQGPETDQSCFR